MYAHGGQPKRCRQMLGTITNSFTLNVNDSMFYQSLCPACGCVEVSVGFLPLTHPDEENSK